MNTQIEGNVTARNIGEEETALIRATFANNEELLKSIRALMFGMTTTGEEKKLIADTFANPALRKIMWKRFCPALDRNSPIGQVQDVWIGVEEMAFGQPPHTIEQAVMYKKISIDYTMQALGLLENPDAAAPELSYSPTRYPNDTLQVHLLGRNQFIKHIEQQLLFLWLIAQTKKETPAEQKTRVHKGSAK